MKRAVIAAGLCLFAQAAVPRVHAEDTPAEPSEFDAGESWREPTDETRLDVARLPADVIPITRDLYASGLFSEARLGVIAAGGALGKIASAGPRASVLLGYTFFRVLSLYADTSFALAQTENRPPPERTSFELLETHLGVRGELPFGPRFSAFVAGSGGFAFTFGDVLRGLGFRDAGKPGLSYGGELGADYHLRTRHHSLGVVGGARMYPGLSRDGTSYAGYGSAYLRYVF